MSRTKRLLLFIGAVFVTLGAVLYFTPTHAYARIEVSLTQGGYYRPGKYPTDGWYDFGYNSTNPFNLSFYIIPGFGPPEMTISPSQIFPLTEGATYRHFGLEMKVTEVHSDYFVLLVRNIS